MASTNPDGLEVIKKISLRVKTDPNTAEQLLSWFESLNDPPFLNTNVWWQCQTVLKEGFDNVIEYAHRSLPPETPIDLEATRFPQTIEIRIWDHGSPFDLTGKLAESPKLEDNTQDHGRGLRIMEQIADHLSYERTLDDRNCLLVIKHY